MKKGYIIIVLVFILLIASIVLFYDYTLQKKKENEFSNLVERVGNLDERFKEELKTIDGNNEIDEKELDEKMDEIDEMAEKTKRENEDILSSDILKSGTSSGGKYSGEACKDVCW